MRVLYVAHQFYPKFVSGTEQYVLSLARAGRRRGDDVRVYALDPQAFEPTAPRTLTSYEFAGVPVTLYRFDQAAIRNQPLNDYDAPEVGESFRALLAEFRPDVVHFFHLRWVGADRLQDVADRSIPFVVHIMDFWFVCPNFLLLRPGNDQCDGPPDRGLGCFGCLFDDTGRRLAAQPGALEALRHRAARGEQPRHEATDDDTALALMQRLPALRRALAKASAVLFPSATVRDLLLANGHRPRRSLLVPYAVDWDLLSRLPPPPPMPPVIGFAGTLTPHKGVDLLIEAVRGLPGDLSLEIHGRFGDHPHFDDRLRQLAAGDRRIHFAGGFERQRLPEVLGRLHCLVVPSRWRENTPFVCLEGRAAGLPIIASDLSGMAEAVPAGSGRLFRAGDADHLRTVLQDVLDEVRRRQGTRLSPDRRIPALDAQFADLRRCYDDLVAART